MAPNAFDVRIQERRSDLSLLHLIAGIAKHHLGNEKETNMPTPYMLGHRRRPHAYDTYTGGVPCLSSFRFEIGDFAIKDESGNTLLDSWLSHRSTRFRPQVTAKIRINSLSAMHKAELFCSVEAK